MLRLLRYVGLGALIAYFFAPQNGRRRRALARDRIRSFFRRGAERTEGAVSAEEKSQPDDATLAHKVESEVFRDVDAPKGQVNVNAENGIVVLRGEVEKPELIRDLEERTRKVQGVRDVENLLHVPGTPAPTR